jgi:hypothetical protein
MSQPRDPGRYYQQAPQRYPQPYQQAPQRYQQAPQRYQQPAAYSPAPEPVRRGPRRIPGVGLILTAVGLAIQVLSLTVLPWVTVDAKTPFSISMLDLRSASIDFGTHGFGAWYVVLFSYPLAALGIVLALAAVLDSVVLKVIWACLALAGVGIAVLSYGFWPLAESVVGGHGTHFTTQKITTAVIALVAGAVVIFVLKSALSMFRRVAGLILLVLAGVHVAAVIDLVKGSGIDNLGIGAYGPAVGYVLTAIAAFTAPRRIPGV